MRALCATLNALLHSAVRMFRTSAEVCVTAGVVSFAVTANTNAQAVSGYVRLKETGRARSNDIGTAFVWLVPIGFTDSRADTIPKQTSIAMRNREFLPHVSVVAMGGSVQFPNEDPFSHNVFSNSELGRFDLGLYPRRKTRTVAVAKSGVYAVYCNIHARMSSFIIAVPTRHVAQVDKRGAFTLRDVPVGEYELHAWHERAAESESRIKVDAVGATVELAMDARGSVPGPHLNKFGQLYPASRADRY